MRFAIPLRIKRRILPRQPGAERNWKFLVRLIVIFGAVLTLLVFLNSYDNPVLNVMDLADPTVAHAGDKYAMTATWDGKTDPVFTIFRSRSLVDWAKDDSFQGIPDTPEANMDYWSPDLSFQKQDGYSLYFAYGPHTYPGAAAKPHSIFVTKAWDLSGPWSKPTKVLDRANEPMLSDIDGDAYLLWTEDDPPQPSQTIFAARLDRAGNIQGRPKEIMTAERNGTKVIHGPFVLPRGEYFYLFYFGGGYDKPSCCQDCDDGIFVARSKSIIGTYELPPHPHPILTGTRYYGRKEWVGVQGWHCFGMGTVVDVSGEPFLVYHGVRKADPNRRVLLVDKLIFGNDEWPRVKGGQPGSEMPSPRLSFHFRQLSKPDLWGCEAFLLFVAVLLYANASQARRDRRNERDRVRRGRGGLRSRPTSMDDRSLR